jgi:predicted ArsR family transcriptional regulator
MSERKWQPPGRTRREILLLLCAAAQTTRALADAVGVSSTAMRKVLVRLEADGYVRHETVRRGVGKPAHEYSITADGEALLSRAYVPLLNELLHVLEERLPAPAVEGLLRETGRRVAGSQHRGRGEGRKRPGTAVAVLNELGGRASFRRARGVATIECTCCAVGAVVTDHALVCRSMAALIEELAGERVTERCERGARPKCRFEIVGALAGERP